MARRELGEELDGPDYDPGEQSGVGGPAHQSTGSVNAGYERASALESDVVHYRLLSALHVMSTHISDTCV